MHKKAAIQILVSALLLCFLCQALAQSIYTPYTFTTIAGDPGYGSNDGTNGSAQFWGPQSIAFSPNSAFYVVDSNNQTIRQMIQQGTNWVVTTIAGQVGTYGSDDGTNFNAQFGFPASMAIDAAGTIYIADMANQEIRQMTQSGTNWAVVTIAGLTQSSGTNDGLGTNAQFFNPSGIAVASATNLYVADTYNNTIRQLTLTTGSTNWMVSTIAGVAGLSGTNDGVGSAARFNSPYGVTVDGLGNLFVSDQVNSTIRQLTPNGSNWTVTTIAGKPGTSGAADGLGSLALLYAPAGITAYQDGNIYFADASSHTIRMLSPSGTNWMVNTIAGLASNPGFADGTNSNARFAYPYGVNFDASGNLFVADEGNGLIRKMSPSGTNWIVTTLAGQARVARSADGTNSAALFSAPANGAVDANGNIYVADSGNNTIRKVSPVGTNWVVTTLAGLAGAYGYVDANGTNARFRQPDGVAIGTDGNIYVADLGNDAIRAITPSGQVSTVDVTRGYVALHQPSDIAADKLGNLFVANTGAHTIIKYFLSGTNWTGQIIAGLAGSAGSSDGTNSRARFNSPQGVAVDGAGNLFVADTGNQIVRKITPVGTNWVVTTPAGTPGGYGSRDGTNGAPQFRDLCGIAVDVAGNVFIADFYNDLIRKMTQVGTNWVVTTIGGRPLRYEKDDGTGSFSRFYWPNGVAVDNHGNIFVADYFNNTIRMGWPENVPATIVTSGAGFGVNGGQFGFNLTGPPGQLVVVESSTDLMNWQPIWTNTFGTAPLSFSDPQTSSFAAQYYRARTP